MRPGLRRLVWLTLLSVFAIRLHSQTHLPEATGPTLKTTARLVVVDVVVTDANGHPVPGLHKEDFKVFEDGKRQVISAFEEHTRKPPAVLRSSPALPPNTFSNFPRAEAPDSLNVVLLDSLNTPLTDQLYVHQQVLRYLAGMHPGQPTAIFLLSARLRLVHGFTSDFSLLLAALNDKKSDTGPQSSPLLRSGGEVHIEQQAAAQMQSLAALDPDVQAALDALRQFQAESESSQTDDRVRTSLFELQQLARYLSGFPGRKNIVWLSGAFPLMTFQGPSLTTSMGAIRRYEEDVRKTADALTRARVAVYPVAASGLVTDPLYDASALPRKVTNAQAATQAQVTQLQNDSAQRIADQATMDELARDTGGRAFYSTNGLDEALAQVSLDGARYYTLDYTPTNRKMDGGYRHIQVKLTYSHYKLAYRRGYDADDEQMARAVTHRLTTDDPLQALMALGLPNFAQILYLMSVKPATPQPDLRAARAGDNTKLEGAFTRMDVDLAVSEKGIELPEGPDHLRHGALEVQFIAYDRYGNQMNWLVRSMEVSLTPERYKALWDIGLQFHFEFDAPRGASYLRSGVCDLTSGKAGTMEVLLSVPPGVVPQESQSN